MPERHPPGVDEEQPVGLGLVEVGDGEPVRGEHRGQHGDVVLARGRDENERPATALGKRRDQRAERRACGLCRRQRVLVRDVVRPAAAHQLVDHQRVARRDAPVPADVVGGVAELGEQSGHALVAEAPEGEGGQAAVERRRARRGPFGDQHDDALGGHPTGDEREGLDRCRVQPLAVVDGDQHRTAARQVGQVAEHADRDAEAAAGRGRAQREGGLQGVALWIGKLVDHVDRGPEQVEQARVGDLDVELVARHRERGHVGRPRAGVRDQRGLADARLAPDDQRSGPAVAGVGEQAVDVGALRRPPVQHR